MRQLARGLRLDRRRSKKAVAEQFAALLRYSRNICIVDRYVLGDDDDETRFLEGIDYILNAGRAGSVFGRADVTIVTGCRTSRDGRPPQRVTQRAARRARALVSELSSRAEPGSVRLLVKLDSQCDLHARFLRTEHALLLFERPGPTRETWYYELPLPADLKKFSKGSPIQDEHFAEARAVWAVWDAHRRGDGPRQEPNRNSWIVSVEDIKARGYDLTARNPHRGEAEAYRRPAEITASLLEKEREILSIIEELHEIVGDGNVE